MVIFHLGRLCVTRAFYRKMFEQVVGSPGRLTEERAKGIILFEVRWRRQTRTLLRLFLLYMKGTGGGNEVQG